MSHDLVDRMVRARSGDIVCGRQYKACVVGAAHVDTSPPAADTIVQWIRRYASRKVVLISAATDAVGLKILFEVVP
jgi:hypothetical protein